MKTHSMLLAVTFLVAARVALPAQAVAQCSERSCTATNIVSVHVGTTLRLGVLNQQAVALGNAATVRSNGGWRLEVTSAAGQSAGATRGGPTTGVTLPLDQQINTATTSPVTVRLTLVGA